MLEAHPAWTVDDLLDLTLFQARMLAFPAEKIRKRAKYVKMPVWAKKNAQRLGYYDPSTE